MISESTFTQRALEKDQNQKQKSAESDQGLHCLRKITEKKMGMIITKSPLQLVP